MINEPNAVQINYIENLQIELRKLQKLSIEELTDNNISQLASRVFRVISIIFGHFLTFKSKTPELSSEIGKLIVEYTLPKEITTDEDFA